ncbi:hypothetical protein CYMTET_17326 [Cymbomonas tetramitiformis]|uniref:Uncharacterized protein n=1 Tax=Cymbomonas tetramitiformis TaxID=36881 RepID=A0AAE0GAV6_9CHLO|nr:hypothetical protein CYMTET_17326 [Cymbomonas tetramitiformis]
MHSSSRCSGMMMMMMMMMMWFQDLTTLFFEEKQMEEKRDGGARAPCHKVAVPTVQQLKINYRTHNGVLGAAGLIVQLMQRFFPNTIDRLEPERGFFDGPKPMLLLQPISEVGLVLSYSSSSGSIEFGAQQACIVRNRAAAETLRGVVAPNGSRPFADVRALTIGETKGLEFDDVIIVDFFADSPASEQDWRVLVQYMQEERAIDLRPEKHSRAAFKTFAYLGGGSRTTGATIAGANRGNAASSSEKLAVHCPEFDRHQHLVLNEELKMLYTAVTRAKARVFFVDSSEPKRSPMWALLEAEGLARHTHVLDVVRDVVVSSPAAGWERMGSSLIGTGNYNMALDCFERAGNQRLVDFARGHQLFKVGEEARSGGRLGVRRRREMIRKAGCLFIRAGRFGEALQCCMLSADHARARRLLPLVDDVNLVMAAQDHLQQDA